MANRPLNLTLISGFLGAGKTTLVNELLRGGYPGETVAVLVNDFGKLAVDASLIQTAGDNLIELRNGCICCSLQYHLHTGLKKLGDQRRFDRVILETSGVSNTEHLLAILGEWQQEHTLHIDQVIAVVDATRFLKSYERLPILRAQLNGAQLILLNRCDQVSWEVRDDTRRALESLAPQAMIAVTEFSRFDFVLLKHLPPRIPVVAGNENHPHPEPWHTCRIEFSEPVALVALQASLAQLPDSIHRIKGFVTDGSSVWAVQRAGMSVSVTKPETPVQSSLVGELVVIASESCAAILRPAFAAIPGTRVIEDEPGRGLPAATNRV